MLDAGVRSLRISAPSTADLNRPETEVMHLAVPRRGHVLQTLVETYGKPIREAVAILASAFAREECAELRSALLSPRLERPEPDSARSDEELAAWAVVSIWVTGVAVKALPTAATLLDAEQWFFGKEGLTAPLSRGVRNRAEAALRAKADASAYSQLLPYVLDPHGPGSRISVRRDPETRSARARKRAGGVYYTPADVAEYMAGSCMAEVKGKTLPRVFDPACGTGVFLRAALQKLKRHASEVDAILLASECLFGTDIDPWPLDATAFVLLADCWTSLHGQSRAPDEAWRRLRMNLACIDTLRIDPTQTNDPGDNTYLPRDGRVSISQLFPTMGGSPTVVLGNPPYADLGPRPDLGELGKAFETLAVKLQPNAEVYLPFVEQMIRLADRRVCSGALVLPLSVACNVGTQFAATRELISRTRGCWRFAFFDREPHALFGEDVKTRNAIILWSRNPSDTKPTMSTGPLRKWRGDSRATMFKSLSFTEIDGDIRAGIPKIDSEYRAALQTLAVRWGRLEQVTKSIGRIELAKTAAADNCTVFVGATAYNFLNVFLKPPRDVFQGVQALSRHPLHAIRCASRIDALAIFGILSSHLAYWWWHTHGDGFHVSRRFVAELPFGATDLSERITETLSEYGAALWLAIREKPITSLNRGRTSLAYTPNGHDDLRRRLDEVLASGAGLEPTFVDQLQRFTARTVAATLHEGTGPENQREDYA